MFTLLSCIVQIHLQVFIVEYIQVRSVVLFRLIRWMGAGITGQIVRARRHGDLLGMGLHFLENVQGLAEASTTDGPAPWRRRSPQIVLKLENQAHKWRSPRRRMHGCERVVFYK